MCGHGAYGKEVWKHEEQDQGRVDGENNMFRATPMVPTVIAESARLKAGQW